MPWSLGKIIVHVILSTKAVSPVAGRQRAAPKGMSILRPSPDESRFQRWFVGQYFWGVAPAGNEAGPLALDDIIFAGSELHTSQDWPSEEGKSSSRSITQRLHATAQATQGVIVKS
jgi:hypothetical protein